MKNMKNGVKESVCVNQKPHQHPDPMLAIDPKEEQCEREEPGK
jgi:hypothetical protein